MKTRLALLSLESMSRLRWVTVDHVIILEYSTEPVVHHIGQCLGGHREKREASQEISFSRRGESDTEEFSIGQRGDKER